MTISTQGTLGQGGAKELLSGIGKLKSIGDLTITDHGYGKLNKLKKTNPEAFYYWYQSIDGL